MPYDIRWYRFSKTLLDAVDMVQCVMASIQSRGVYVIEMITPAFLGNPPYSVIVYAAQRPFLSWSTTTLYCSLIDFFFSFLGLTTV